MRRALALAVVVAACTPVTPGPANGKPPDVSVPIGTNPTPMATAASQGKPWEAPKAPTPTAMAHDLEELGLDPKALPPLGKLDPSTLRKVMKTFTKSLGVKCADCHDVKDFRAPSRNKTVATHMWNDFARGLALKDGDAPLYCDSCHGGKPRFLDRSDPKQLGAWMNRNYVDALVRTDLDGHGCATCHGEPFEPRILQRWK